MDYAGIAKDIGIGIIMPVARSVFGWAENALEDKKVTNLELAQLGATIVRVGFISGCMYFGATQFLGMEISVLGAGASAVVLDFVLRKLDKLRPAKKK